MVFDTKRERFLFIVGILVGLAICAPIILMNPVASPPDEYSTLIIENKIEYNALYNNFVDETGSAIDGDIAIQIEFNLTDSIYNNIGVILAGNEDIHLYALCFYDNNKATIYIQKHPEINNWYNMESVEDLLGVIVFYHRDAEAVLKVATWIW